MLGAKAENLPYVILDSDSSGCGAKNKLQSGLYSSCKDRLLETGGICKVKDSEIEDCIPFELLVRGINRLFIAVEDEYFEDVYDSSKAILPQIEAFATTHSISLERGWKVTLAKGVKQILKTKVSSDINQIYIDMWCKLFGIFCG